MKKLRISALLCFLLVITGSIANAITFTRTDAGTSAGGTVTLHLFAKKAFFPFTQADLGSKSFTNPQSQTYTVPSGYAASSFTVNIGGGESVVHQLPTDDTYAESEVYDFGTYSIIVMVYLEDGQWKISAMLAPPVG